MNFKLKNVAVFGAGVMGAGIACHLANIGMNVVMLDIIPFDLSESEKNEKSSRNRIADSSLLKAINLVFGLKEALKPEKLFILISEIFEISVMFQIELIFSELEIW